MFAPSPYIFHNTVSTVMIAVARTMQTMLLTTAEVVARPTAAESRPQFMPW
jgi:hypothetical protein